MTVLGNVVTSRKIIQLGKDTFVVSLPSAWTKHYRLKKGDELEVDEQGPRLVFYPKSETKPGKVSVDVSGTKPMIKRILGALYKVGYDEFEVRFESSEELDAIKEVMDEFVGFELLEEGKNRVLVKNVSHIIPEEFDNMFRKMIFVIDTMAQDGLTNSKAKKWERLKFVALTDFEVNKYADFCRRILNTVGHRIVKRTPPSYYLVEQLEKIGDNFRDICLYCGNNRVALGGDVSLVYAKVCEFFRQFRVLYGKFDLKAATEFAKNHYELKAELEKLVQSTDKEELPVLVLLKIAESDVFDMNGALMAEKL